MAATRPVVPEQENVRNVIRSLLAHELAHATLAARFEFDPVEVNEKVDHDGDEYLQVRVSFCGAKATPADVMELHALTEVVRDLLKERGYDDVSMIPWFVSRQGWDRDAPLPSARSSS